VTALAAAVVPSRRNVPAPEGSFVPVIIASLAFHLVIFVGIPFLARVLYHAEKYERPKTFTLVNMPKALEQPRAAQAARIKPKATTPVPSKSRAKNPVKKDEKQQENNDQLNELLDAIPASVSDITKGQSFKYAWYINSVISKVEENWKPPMGLTDKKDASVTVVFTIFSGGDISKAAVSESSGISTLDNLALRAVQSAAPFGKLPVGYQMDRLDIRYVLHYVKQ
jgi:TonB family protein